MKKYDQALIVVTELKVKDIITASAAADWTDNDQKINPDDALTENAGDLGWTDLFTPLN